MVDIFGLGLVNNKLLVWRDRWKFCSTDKADAAQADGFAQNGFQVRLLTALLRSA